MDPFCYLCFMFVFIMLSSLFLVALKSPAGKRVVLLTPVYVILSFQYGILGHVCYFIV